MDRQRSGNAGVEPLEPASDGRELIGRQPRHDVEEADEIGGRLGNDMIELVGIEQAPVADELRHRAGPHLPFAKTLRRGVPESFAAALAWRRPGQTYPEIRFSMSAGVRIVIAGNP